LIITKFIEKLNRDRLSGGIVRCIGLTSQLLWRLRRNNCSSGQPRVQV